ncbi:hypothetical protein GEMRC1_006687 [Eukaryota sp. GEM-RC1]
MSENDLSDSQSNPEDESIDLGNASNCDSKTDESVVKEHRQSNGWKFWVILGTLFLVLFGIISVSTLMFQLNDLVGYLTARPGEVSLIAENIEMLLENVRDMSKTVVAFASTGNLRYYHRYFSLYYSLERTNAFSALRRVDIDAESLKYLGNFKFYQETLEYKDLIVFKIAQLAFNYSDYDMPNVASVTYDVTKETDWELIDLEYYDVHYWYSSLEKDSQLEPEELRTLSRSIVTNRRHMDLDFKRISNIFNFVHDIFAQFQTQVESVNDSVQINVFIALAILVPCAIFIVILFIGSFTFYSFFTHRIASLIFLFLIAVSLIGSIIFVISTYNSFSSFYSNVSSKLEIDSSFDVVDFNEMVSEYFIFIFVQFGNTNVFNEVNTRRQFFADFLTSTESVLDSEITSEFRETLSVFYNSVKELAFVDSRYIEDVAITLAASGFDIPEMIIGRSLEWNFSNQSDYWHFKTTFDYIDWSSFYSNNSHDLSLTVYNQIRLAQSILVSDIYYQVLIRDYELLVGISVAFDTSSAEIIQNSESTFNSNFFSLIGVLFISCFLITISIILFYFSLSEQSIKKLHVKEKLVFAAMKVLKIKYILALTFLAVLISLFYYLAIFMSLESIPRVNSMWLAGERFIMTKRVTGNSLILLDNDSPLQSSIVSFIAEQLREKHLQLLFGDDELLGSIGVDLDQDLMLFDSGFSLNSSILTSGIHVLFENFIQISRELASFDTVIDGNNPLLHDLISQSRTLSTLLYESLAVYRDDSQSFLNRFRNLVVIVFFAILVVILLEYFFIFRTMINQLSKVRTNCNVITSKCYHKRPLIPSK